MDKNKVAGSIKEVEGAAKEAIGKAVGDAKLQSDGEADKAVDKISAGLLAASTTQCATRKR